MNSVVGFAKPGVFYLQRMNLKGPFPSSFENTIYTVIYADTHEDCSIGEHRPTESQ